MKNLPFEKTAFIYFCVSWNIGSITIISTFTGFEDLAIWLLLIGVGLNFFINVLVIVQLIVLWSTFSENRKRFSNSIFLLLFNLPFVVVAFLLFGIFPAF